VLSKIKTKASGIDGVTKKNIDDTRLKKLSKDLKVQIYKPKPNKKVPISKSDGGVRYLGIASAIDKVVQEVLHQLLKKLTEPLFSKYSYGFRPNKGCHDALYDIRYG